MSHINIYSAGVVQQISGKGHFWVCKQLTILLMIVVVVSLQSNENNSAKNLNFFFSKIILIPKYELSIENQ